MTDMTIIQGDIDGFKLTPAESRIALGIARGEALADIAHAHGISVNTARTQLRSIFSKTHTHRQAELAVLLMARSTGR
jgi:DNA-binding CsgD family transcriptional regulator